MSLAYYNIVLPSKTSSLTFIAESNLVNFINILSELTLEAFQHYN